MKECCKAYLAEQFGGDADIMKEIYDEYVSSVGVKLGEAKAALAAGDWTQLDHIAHTVKGNALAAGDVEMSEPAIALRKVAVLKESAECERLIAKMEELAKTL